MVTKKPKGLGRGLDALLGPSLSVGAAEGSAPATPAGTPMMLSLDALAPGQLPVLQSLIDLAHQANDLPQAVQWLTAQGVRFAPGGIRKGAAGYDITFLHPKSNDEFPIAGEGVLIELVQAPADVIAALGG